MTKIVIHGQAVKQQDLDIACCCQTAQEEWGTRP